MAKQVGSFRLDEELLVWLEDVSASMNVPRAALVEDALRQAVVIHNSAVVNVASMWETLCDRYRPDDEIVMWCDGEGLPHVRIDGKDPEDVHAQISIDPEGGLAHLFLEVDGWSFERYGTSRWGTAVMATMPLLAAATLPWPANKDQPAAVVGRLGDIARSKTKPRTDEKVEA
jgi:hypothetical protein